MSKPGCLTCTRKRGYPRLWDRRDRTLNAPLLRLPLPPPLSLHTGYGIAFLFLVLKSVPVGRLFMRSLVGTWRRRQLTAIARLLQRAKLRCGLCRYGAHNCAAFARPIPIVEVAAEADAMVTVVRHSESHRGLSSMRAGGADPAGAVTAAIEMLRVGSDVVDVGPAASHPDARPVSPGR